MPSTEPESVPTPAYSAADAEFFFTEPQVEVPHGRKSVLYLLRREIQDCLFGQVCDERQALLLERRSRLFASTMVIFSGLDLLSIFASGRDSFHGAGKRFQTFLVRFGALSESDAAAIWRFRNSLMHSFGLFHRTPEGTPIRAWLFQQDSPAPVVRRVDEPLVAGGSVEGWELSVDDLFELFVNAQDCYRDRLCEDSHLQKGFAEVFPHYGALTHRGSGPQHRRLSRGEWPASWNRT